MHEEQRQGIHARLQAVRSRIAAAASRAGRAPDSVRLLAVSKGQPPEAIRAVYDAGQRELGENYVQELAAKAEALRDLEGLVWHFIGGLQRNKAKDVVAHAAIVQVVDREELARELDRRAGAAGRELDVLLEVNVGGEASKSGCAPEQLGGLLARCAELGRLRVRGLMTIPPATSDPEDARRFFAALRELRDRHGGAGALPELSMGMSHDFEAAIAEGATIVRVGTAIFGARLVSAK